MFPIMGIAMKPHEAHCPQHTGGVQRGASGNARIACALDQRRAGSEVDEQQRGSGVLFKSEGAEWRTGAVRGGGLSPSACLRRVQELERKGVIAGYRAVINPAALGKSFLAYVTVGLAQHAKADQLAFERAMALATEVRECHNVTGTVEYLLRVEVRDLAAYKHFHTEVLGMAPKVASITSYIVMESPKDERA